MNAHELYCDDWAVSPNGELHLYLDESDDGEEHDKLLEVFKPGSQISIAIYEYPRYESDLPIYFDIL